MGPSSGSRFDPKWAHWQIVLVLWWIREFSGLILTDWYQLHVQWFPNRTWDWRKVSMCDCLVWSLYVYNIENIACINLTTRYCPRRYYFTTCDIWTAVTFTVLRCTRHQVYRKSPFNANRLGGSYTQEYYIRYHRGLLLQPTKWKGFECVSGALTDS